MRHLKWWLVQFCLLWHVMKIIKCQSEMLSNESMFRLSKHPNAKRADGSQIIKNITNECSNHNDTRDGDDKIAKATAHSSSPSDNNTVNILNIFKNILQNFQKNKTAKNLYEKVENEQQNDCDLVAQQQKEFDSQEQQFVQQRFSILQQLRQHEQQQKWQQHQLELQQQQQALRWQNVLQSIENESLSKAGKKKKKKKKKRKRKKKKPTKDKRKKRKKNKQKPIKKPTSLLAHPAQILFASATQKPHHHYQPHDDDRRTTTTTTTETPFLQHPLLPVKKIKYILRKNTMFKKKKKEYLNHLKHVVYPFVKFIAFFTIINPFTLAVFLFSLASPVVFGFLGFIALSFFIKPALNLLFGIRHTVNTIKRRKLQQLRRRQRLRDSRRPITIHKHYYQQTPTIPAPHRHHRPPVLAVKPKGSTHHTLPLDKTHLQRPPPSQTQQVKLFNPLLPDVRQKFKKAQYFIPDIRGHHDSFEQF